jgi:chemotaxis signal transduction protein
MAAEKLPVLRPNAWLLDFGHAFRAAVGTRVMLQITDSPRLHPLPCTPPHCRNAVFWQGRLLPVMDMAARLGGPAQTQRLLAVVGYQDRQGEPTRFGALLLAAPPVAIAVGDDQSCALPEQPADWKKFSVSCFDYRGTAVPVLHLPRIFSRAGEA